MKVSREEIQVTGAKLEIALALQDLTIAELVQLKEALIGRDTPSLRSIFFEMGPENTNLLIDAVLVLDDAQIIHSVEAMIQEKEDIVAFKNGGIVA